MLQFEFYVVKGGATNRDGLVLATIRYMLPRCPILWSFWCCHIWCQIHFFLNNLLENKEMNFTNGVINTKAASYNGEPSLQIWKNCFGIKSAVDLIPSRSSSQDEENCSNLMLPLAKFDYVDITNDCTLFHSRTRQGFLLMYLNTYYIQAGPSKMSYLVPLALYVSALIFFESKPQSDS